MQSISVPQRRTLQLGWSSSTRTSAGSFTTLFSEDGSLGEARAFRKESALLGTGNRLTTWIRHCGRISYALSSHRVWHSSFFFDGEKIKRLAEEETEALALGESIKALLGLDLVERLQADLDIFSARQARRTARKKTASRLRELDKELTKLLGELENLEQDMRQLGDDHAKLEAKILEVEERLVQSGEGLTFRREDLRQKEANLAAELAATEKSAHDLLDGAAPFLLCPQNGVNLARQLELEGARCDWEVGSEHAHNVVRDDPSETDYCIKPASPSR